MYQIVNDKSVRRLSDGALIPMDPANRDYLSYRAWLAEDEANKPEPIPGPTPQEVSALIDSERDRRLSLGVEHQGKRFSLSDQVRADLGGMATTAALVLAGALPWPDSYALGWISEDNTRLPLPTPADGIALAAAVALSYSAIVQRARDIKDAVLAGEEIDYLTDEAWMPGPPEPDAPSDPA